MGIGYSQQGGQNYRTQEILMSPPEKCVEKVYDIAIGGCMAKESQKTGRALATLIDSLNFEQGGEIAVRLYSLYEYCLREVHQNQFENTEKILRTLRDTWKQAVDNHKAA